ncbi:MAG: hypothetical protein ACI4JM_08945 [Oscillospiraceae bacterium]
MIPMDTWAVTEITDDGVMVECPFTDGSPMKVSTDEIGFCDVGDILSTETGGWDYLKADELNDLSDEGRKIFEDYIKRKGFRYSNIAEYSFIADR